MSDIHVTINDKVVELSRLNDTKYRYLRNSSLAISDDYGLHLALYSYAERKRISMNFAQIYAALKVLSGESSKLLIDDWKSSFMFPFLAEVMKNDQTYIYLFRVFNCKDSLYFNLRKCISPDDNRYDRTIIHKPFENEFSRQEINTFITYFYGYLAGFFNTIRDQFNESFIQKVESNYILFGYKEGKFFENHYDNTDDFDKAVQQITKTITPPAELEQFKRI